MKIKRLYIFTIIYILIINNINLSNKLIYEKENNLDIDNNKMIKNEVVQINNKKHYFDNDGIIKKKYLLEDYNGEETYYFDENGQMATNTWLCISKNKVINKEDDNREVYWYYFNEKGSAIKAHNNNIKMYYIDGNKYLFNKYGQMLTGFVSEDGEILSFENSENLFAEAMYYCGDDNDGIVKTGWFNYRYGYELNEEDTDDYRYDLENIWLYFDTKNGKKVTGSKKINGYQYLFDKEGIMLTGWTPYDIKLIASSSYYGEKDEGKKYKNQWIYDVPTKDMGVEAYEDKIKKFFYTNESGDLVRNKIKRINKKYYAFNKEGIMQTGLVIMHETDGYIATCDFDYANAEDLLKRGEIATSETSTFYINGDGTASNDNTIYPNKGRVKLHYFDKNGDRQIGENRINFSDTDIILITNNAGNLSTGKRNNKYYVNGILLKSNEEYNYGLVATKENSIYKPQIDFFEYDIIDNKYQLVDNKGNIMKYKKSAYKDDDIYYLVNKWNYVKGIWQKEIKEVKSFNFIFEEQFTEDISSLRSDEILEFLSNKNLINKNIFNENNNNYTFDILNNKNGYKIKLTINSGFVFKSSFDERNERFAPCGVLDNNKKTIDCSNWNNGEYQVIMNDAYFVNCYWD